MPKTLTRSEQRERTSLQTMLSFSLHARLHCLMREIRLGDTTKLSEFQSMIQYAPDQMRLRLLEELDKPVEQD